MAPTTTHPHNENAYLRYLLIALIGSNSNVLDARISFYSQNFHISTIDKNSHGETKTDAAALYI